MKSVQGDIESGLAEDHFEPAQKRESENEARERETQTQIERAWQSLLGENAQRLRDWEWVEESMLSGYNAFAAYEAHSRLWDEHRERARSLYAQCSSLTASCVQQTADFLAQSLPSSTPSPFAAFDLLRDRRAGRDGEEEQYVHKHPHSLAMSGCGWLIPFHLGVLRAFQDAGYLDADTVFAGTSGGAIAALVGALEISPDRALDELVALSADETFKRDIDEGLRGVLQRLIRRSAFTRDGNREENSSDAERVDDTSGREDDAHTQRVLSLCNTRLRVTVTRLWPLSLSLSLAPAAPLVVSRFHSERELLDVVAASCFIPLYSSSRRVATKIVDHSEIIAERESESSIGANRASETRGEGDVNTASSVFLERNAMVDDRERFDGNHRVKASNSSIERSVEHIEHVGDNQTITQMEIKTETTIESETETEFVTVNEVPRETKSERDRGYFIDGGVFAFIPPVGEVRVSPFPAHYLRSFTDPPDITLSPDDYPLSQLLHWAFYPPPEDALRDLFHKGRQAAERWILKHEAYLEKIKRERERELEMTGNISQVQSEQEEKEIGKGEEDEEKSAENCENTGKADRSEGTEDLMERGDQTPTQEKTTNNEQERRLGEELTTMLGLDWIRDAPKVEDLASLPEFLKQMVKGTIR